MPSEFDASQTHVGVINDGVTVASEGAPLESIARADIVEILVETFSGDAPSRHVLWFIKHSKGWTLFFPGGSSGEAQLLEWFRSFDGFDWTKLEEARACETRTDFVLWRRQ